DMTTNTATAPIPVPVKAPGHFDAILEYGKEKGHLTYDEINERLPDNMTAEDIEELYEELEAQNITVSDEAVDRDSLRIDEKEEPEGGYTEPFREEITQDDLESAKIDDP